MVLENRIVKAAKARNLVLTVGVGILTVAGCGFGSARDGHSAQDAAAAIELEECIKREKARLKRKEKELVDEAEAFAKKLLEED